MSDDADDDLEEESSYPPCGYCNGTGGNPWDDGTTPCPHCDGEGYQWWL